MITVEILNDYMPKTLLSSELALVGWGTDAVTKSDKELLIENATYYLKHNVVYTGYLVDINQENPFPRIINSITIEPTNTNVVKAICCVVYDMLAYTTNERAKLINQGVKSISTGGVSESYIEKTTEVTDKFKKYLDRYLFKGVL